jgi:palmitoyl-protein thioesterase
MRRKFSTLLILLTFSSLNLAYKPVVLIHGILSDAGSMEIIADRIKSVRLFYNFLCLQILILKFFFKNHPGTEVYIIDKFNNWQSLEHVLGQIESFFDDFDAIFAKHPEGFIFQLGFMN